MSDVGWIGPPKEHLQLVHGELKAALALQIAELAGLDERAVRLLTPAGVVLGLGVASLRRSGRTQPADVMLVAGLALLLASFLAGVYALRLRNVEYAPIADLWPRYAHGPSEALLAGECSSLAQACRVNDGLRGSKRPWIACQFWSLLAGSPLLTVGLSLRLAGIVG